MSKIKQILQESLEECHNKGNKYLGDNFVDLANEIRRMEESSVYTLQIAMMTNHDKVYYELMNNPELREQLYAMLYSIDQDLSYANNRSEG
jgi:hypothetical protein